MKVLSSILMIVLFTGCATKIEYKEVLVPSPCTVEMPKLKKVASLHEVHGVEAGTLGLAKGGKASQRNTKLESNIVERVREALIYSDKLEAALRFCRAEH